MGKIQISKLLPILFIVLSVSNQGCKQKSKVTGLTKAEKEQGWELLFEGNSTEKWRGYNQDGQNA
jgi:hypothetical protein